MRVILQPVYILHSRPYRETSCLLDVLSKQYGRVSLIARGVRQSRSVYKAVLQPFTPLIVSWQGKSDLMTLVSAEAEGLPHSLRGSCLLSGFYLNELLIRLLHKHDPHPEVYTIYHQTLVELSKHVLSEKSLRIFEKRLLCELGYGLPLGRDSLSGLPILPGKYYRYYPDNGFELCQEGLMIDTSVRVFSGKSLCALASETLEEADVLADVKRLMRLVFASLLGSTPLQTRKLFVEVQKK